MYAKIIDGVVSVYPYNTLHQDYPNTSFPYPLTAKDLPAGIVIVHEAQQPSVDYTKSVAEGVPELVNGKWTQSWVISDRSAEEIAATAARMRSKAYRAESDPLFFKVQRGEATHQEWLNKVAEIKSRYPE
jgi:hypothetical protein